MKDRLRKPGRRRRFASLALAICLAATCLLPTAVSAAGIDERRVERYVAIRTGEHGRVVEIDNHGRPLDWKDARKAVAWISGDENLTLLRESRRLDTASAVRTGDRTRFGDGTEAPIVMKCDLLRTGSVSISQIVACARHLNQEETLTGPPFLAGDIDGCGQITIVDLVLLAKRLREKKGAQGPLENLPDAQTGGDPGEKPSPLPTQSAGPSAPAAPPEPSSGSQLPPSYGDPQGGFATVPTSPGVPPAGSGNSANLTPSGPALSPGAGEPAPTVPPSSTGAPEEGVGEGPVAPPSSSNAPSPGPSQTPSSAASESPAASDKPASPSSEPSGSDGPEISPSPDAGASSSPSPEPSGSDGPEVSPSPDADASSSLSPEPSATDSRDEPDAPKDWYDEKDGVAPKIFEKLNQAREAGGLGELLPSDDFTRTATENISALETAATPPVSSGPAEDAPAQIWASAEIGKRNEELSAEELSDALAESILDDSVWKQMEESADLEAGLFLSQPLDGSVHVNLVLRASAPEEPEEPIPAFDKSTMTKQLKDDFKKRWIERGAKIAYPDGFVSRVAEKLAASPEGGLPARNSVNDLEWNDEYDPERFLGFSYRADLRSYPDGNSSPLETDYAALSAGCLEAFEKDNRWGAALQGEYCAYGVGISGVHDGEVRLHLLLYQEEMWRPSEGSKEKLKSGLYERIRKAVGATDANGKMETNKALEQIARAKLNSQGTSIDPSKESDWPVALTGGEALLLRAEVPGLEVNQDTADADFYAVKAVTGPAFNAFKGNPGWKQTLSGDVQIGVAFSDVGEDGRIHAVAVAYVSPQDSATAAP